MKNVESFDKKINEKFIGIGKFYNHITPWLSMWYQTAEDQNGKIINEKKI